MDQYTEVKKVISLILSWRLSNQIVFLFAAFRNKMKIALIFLSAIGAVIGEIAPVPTNTAVIANNDMSMICLITNHSTVRKWSFYNPTLAIPSIFTKQGSSGRFHELFRHFGVRINANGSVTIFTNSTRSSDAGIYTCHCEIDGNDVEYSAHLIVLESLPVCESNLTSNNSHRLIDGDSIWFQCSVNFSGFWAPSMEWIQYGGDAGREGKRVTVGIETNLNSNQSVTSKLNITIDSSTNGCYFSCKIYFAKSDSTKETTANNIPNFSYTWNSSVIVASQSAFTVTPSTTETSSVNWYLAFLSIVAGMALLVILLIALAIARFIRLKKTVSEPRIESATITPGSSVPASHGAQNSRPLKYLGGDGTEYMEVNVVGGQPVPARRPVQPNMFNVVGDYAFIDHTLSPPIPPRGKNA